MKTLRTSPMGALASGLIAGAAGSLAQDLFFSATSKITPKPPKDAFEPPEPEQRDETATQTVARRTVEKLAQRGPLSDKEFAGKLVHYGFGACWGGLYGLLAGSSRVISRPTGALGFGIGVWAVSDNVILPSFRLGAWPQAYPARNHLYAIAAHLIYGGAVWGTVQAVRRGKWAALVAMMGIPLALRQAPRLVKAPLRRAAVTVSRAAERVTHAPRAQV